MKPRKLPFVSLTPGKYVLAVSGGVDSMVLLDLLRRQPGLRLVVAHLDHGVREDSAEDRRLVQRVARRHGLPFVYHEARLGKRVSEATARTARYDFLSQTRRASGARAVVTAHHQDDLLETAILNLLRGTGRKGLASLGSAHGLKRPLLDIPKANLLAYAQDQDLQWHEDSTNRDTDYLRNYVRRKLLPRFDKVAREQLSSTINNLRTTNRELDTLLVNHLHIQRRSNSLERGWFNQLPHAVAREILASWLRAYELNGFDRPMLERLVVAAKTSRSGKVYDILQGAQIKVGAEHLALRLAER